MPDFIPTQSTAGRLGSMFGGVAGGAIQGVGAGIEDLLNRKMAEVQKKKELMESSKLLQNATGLPPEIATYLQTLTPKERMPMMQAFAQQMQGQPSQADKLQQQIQQLQQAAQPQFGGPYQQQFQGQPQQGYQTPQQEVLRQQQTRQQLQQAQQLPSKQNNLLQAFRTPSAAESKEGSEAYKKLAADRSSAFEENKLLDEYDKLIAKNDIHNPVTVAVLDKLGFPGNLSTQAARKIGVGLAKNAKSWFGSRMTQGEFETYMQQLPSLANTDEGKKYLINIKRAENNAKIIKADAMDKIIQENGGRRPYNLQALAEQRVADQLDQQKNIINNQISEYNQANPGQQRASYEVGQSLGQMPSANSVPAGTQIQDEKSGAIYTSDGNSWTKKGKTKILKVKGLAPRIYGEK